MERTGNSIKEYLPQRLNYGQYAAENLVRMDKYKWPTGLLCDLRDGFSLYKG